MTDSFSDRVPPHGSRRGLTRPPRALPSGPRGMAASVLRPPPLGARQHQYPLRNTPPSISFDEMEPDGTNSPAVIDPSDPTHARGRRLSFSSSAVRRAPTNSASTTRARAASGAFLASTTSSRGNISIDDVRSELGSVTNQLELVQRRALARRVSTMPAASHGYSLRSSGAVDTIASTTMPERAHGDQNLFRGAHAQHAPARACSSGGIVSSPPVLSQHSFSGLSVPAMAQTFEPRVESTEDAPTCGARALATHEYASTLDGASFAMDRLGGATTVTELCSSSPISDVSSIGGTTRSRRCR